MNMDQSRKPHNLEELFSQLEQMARGHERVTLHDALHAFGQRTFGPWLLLIGLITLSPIGDIPGVPTLMATVILLVAGQLLFQHKHFWLPRWLMCRSVSAQKFRKAMTWSRKPARFIDRFLKPRLEFFTGGAGAYVIAVLCVGIALGLPPMEFIPFSASGAGIALTLFGLALVANDGLVAVLGVAFMAATYGVVGMQLIGG